MVGDSGDNLGAPAGLAARRLGLVRCVNGDAGSVRGLAFHIGGHELHHPRIVGERYSATG